MPYILLLFGAVMLVAGVRDKHVELWNLIRNDFTQPGGFLTWVAAIAVVGGMGYIPKLKPLSVAFMTLLLIVLVLSNGGVFAQLQQFIQSGGGGAGGGAAPETPKASFGGLPDLDVISENLKKGLGQ